MNNNFNDEHTGDQRGAGTAMPYVEGYAAQAQTSDIMPHTHAAHTAHAAFAATSAGTAVYDSSVPGASNITGAANSSGSAGYADVYSPYAAGPQPVTNETATNETAGGWAGQQWTAQPAGQPGYAPPNPAFPGYGPQPMQPQPSFQTQQQAQPPLQPSFQPPLQPQDAFQDRFQPSLQPPRHQSIAVVTTRPWRPLADCSFAEAIQRVFLGYLTFDGRSSPREFWFGTLFNLMVTLALASLKLTSILASRIIPFADLFMMLSILWSVAMFVPMLALSVRRAHDSGHSGRHVAAITVINTIGSVAHLVSLVSAAISVAAILASYHSPTVWIYNTAGMTSMAASLIGWLSYLIAGIWCIWLMTRPSDPAATRWDRNR